MNRAKWLQLLVLVLLVGGLIAGAALTVYFRDLPSHLSQHETLIYGQNTFTPGSSGALRVVVRDSASGMPLAGASIQLALRAKDGASLPLYQGQTGPQGSADVAFTVPETTQSAQTLVIETRSSLGSDRVERPVTVQRDYRVLLTTDKPLYQPGQVIHLRALALGAFDLKPANAQSLEVTIADGKGNKVFRKTLTTSAYGAAAADFELASEVNSGAYKLTAKLGNTSSEKTVTVENYVLPKFEVKLQTQKTFYQPGEKVRGTLKANYFFGKPVAGGKVQIEGYTFDVQRTVVLKIDGKTDAQGNYAFEFDLPKYLTGSDMDKGSGRFYLQAAVTDATLHAELSNLSLPVSRNSLLIEAVPEAGYLRLGVENLLYIMTSYPDGSPAEVSLKITFPNENNETLTVATGAYGLAEIRRTPRAATQRVLIEARDKNGSLNQQQFTFTSQYSGSETVLLRPDRPVYRVGEAMKLTILSTPASGTVYLDIVREGQAVSTRALDVRDGRAELTVDLTPDLYGTLELHAYKINSAGTMLRDTRMVVVDQGEGLKIAMQAGQETYKPGDAGKLNLNVTASDGQGAQAAVGLAIVDESVFALAQQDPGFAKLYFLLEKELLEPKYDLHGYSFTDLATGGGKPAADPQLNAAVSQAAQASLAEAVKKSFTFSLQVNSRVDRLQTAKQISTQFFGVFTVVLVVWVSLIPLVMTAMAGLSLRRGKVLVRSLLLLAGLVAIIMLLIAVWPVDAKNSWGTSYGAKAQYLLIQLMNPYAIWLPWLALAGALGLLGLIISASVRKDSYLGWQLGLLPVLAALIYLLAQAANSGSTQFVNAPWGTVLIVGLIAGVSLLILSFWLHFSGFIAQRRFWPALSALPVALMLIALLVIVLSPSLGRTFRNVSMPLIMEDGLANRELGGIAPPRAAEIPWAVGIPAPVAEQATKGADSSAQPAAANEPPRLRQYFPETLLWLPDAVTQPDGSLSVNVPIADSITTWRITALASTQDGRLGSTSGPLRVFQDFFVDLDLPAALTVGDEIAVPVGVFNYLPTEQTVKLELALADWFELKDQAVKEIKIASNEISVVYFRIQAKKFGQQPFQVTAWGSKLSDAIKKEVTVYPDGKQIRASQSDLLAVGKPVTSVVKIPAEAIAGTQRLWVKIFPGMLSQVVDGLDNILRMPSGCFEQTSSTTYPNVLVLDYLKATNQVAPEVQMKAEQYINLGYQRLTTFEVKSSGGFSLFGSEPADRMLTAYGLQEFGDMSHVHEVDPALLQRAAKWLLSQQGSDGSWANDKGLVHENTWQQLGNDKLPVTAYIVWSLVDAGFGSESGTQNGLNYVREFQSQAKDPYALALVANALVSADLKAGGKLTPPAEDALNRLAALAKLDGDKVYWTSAVASFMGSSGQTGSIETTALASLALQRAGLRPDLAGGARVYLLKQKDSFGTWHNTQATVLTLKALIQSVRSGGEKVNATVTVTLNGAQARAVKVTPENLDVVQLLSFDDVTPGRDNQVELKVEGQGNLMYQVASSYYLPWAVLGKYPDLVPPQNAVSIEVKYDRASLAVNDTVGVTVTVRLNQKAARAESALVDLGLPPGFTVLSEDLSALVEKYQGMGKSYTGATFQRYELTGRQILVYLTNLSEGQPLTFSYRLRAKYPLAVRSPASSAYDYYNPSLSGEKAPVEIVVK